MHDFLLAKEIVSTAAEVAREKGLSKVSEVSLEIGQIALAHDGFDEHVEDVSEENLLFGIEALAKGTLLEGAKFDIRKTADKSWRLVSMRGEKGEQENK